MSSIPLRQKHHAIFYSLLLPTATTTTITMPKGVIYLTPEQEARRDQLGLEAGLKGAAIGLGIGALGFIMVTRRSAEFRALSRPMQAIMPTAGNGVENSDFSLFVY